MNLYIHLLYTHLYVYVCVFKCAKAHTWADVPCFSFNLFLVALKFVAWWHLVVSWLLTISKTNTILHFANTNTNKRAQLHTNIYLRTINYYKCTTTTSSKLYKYSLIKQTDDTVAHTYIQLETRTYRPIHIHTYFCKPHRVITVGSLRQSEMENVSQICFIIRFLTHKVNLRVGWYRHVVEPFLDLLSVYFSFCKIYC